MSNTQEPKPKDPYPLRQKIAELKYKEVDYWIHQLLHAFDSPDISIHDVQLDGDQFMTLICDLQDRTAIAIQTDYTAPSVDESLRWISLETQAIEKLVQVFARHHEAP